MRRKRIMMNRSMNLTIIMVLIFTVSAGSLFAGGKKEKSEPAKDAQEPRLQASTVADPRGLVGKFPFQFELAEYEEKSGSKLVLRENPSIADLNARISGNPSLPLL